MNTNEQEHEEVLGEVCDIDADACDGPLENADENGQPYDDTYFDEEFGAYEEPPIPEYVSYKPVYRVPVPSSKYPEPIFGNFVSVKDL